MEKFADLMLSVQGIVHKIVFFIFFFFFGITGVLTQGPRLASWVFYHLSHSASPGFGGFTN
jgi:hypothetical protein